MVKDLLALLLSVLGIAAITFCSLQGGWWLLGVPLATLVCLASFARVIHIETRRQVNGS
jgi:hypothetical protein